MPSHRQQHDAPEKMQQTFEICQKRIQQKEETKQFGYVNQQRVLNYIIEMEMQMEMQML